MIGLIAILREIGHSVIHGDGEGKLQRPQDFGKDRFDAPAKSERLGCIGLRQQQSEFVPTDPKSGIGCAQSFLQCDGCGAEDFVAAWMTVAVVDFLEAMKIEKNNSQRKTITPFAIQFLLEGLGEETAI